MSLKNLIIKGARQNNLKNISLELPHNKLIAVTGVSGSGKSSLAFDTIFAEGQWRFIESLSTYARLFLEKLDRPDVDEIRNIRPAIALEQKNPVKGSRSTVGTLTEIYDLFRLLYSKIAVPFCPNCGKEIRMWDTSGVVKCLLEEHAGAKALIVFDTTESLDELRKKGFQRVLSEGEVLDLDEIGSRYAGGEMISVVLDRLVIRDEPRLADSIEMAWTMGNGKAKVILVGISEPHTLTFSSKNACDVCGIEIPLPYPLLFSFNHPVGACPECKGFGNILRYDEAIIIPDQDRSLAGGAVDPWNKPANKWWRQQILKKGTKAGIRVDVPVRELSPEEKKLLFKGGRGLYGIDDFFEDLEGRRYKLHVRVFLSRYRRPLSCPSCGGKRLQRDALAYRIAGMDIAELSALPVSFASDFFADPEISPFQRDMAREILRQINQKLAFLKRVGLEYVSLNRESRTLSGGEYQRVNLSTQIASSLTGTLYVLDEPTVGLHARDTKIVAEIMSELSQLGNTVLVVEHDKSIIKSADWIVELGPGGGHLGGKVVFSGPIDKFLKSDTVTAKYLKGDLSIGGMTTKRSGSGERLMLHGASGHNLKEVDLEIPLVTLTTVTGVSGSGKSTLITETLYRALAREFKSEQSFPLPFRTIEGAQHLRGAKLISQSPIGRSPRSNPVTYLKIFDQIRKVFSEQAEARAHGYGPGFFSFNVSGGRCETCKGAGFQKLEMYFFEDLYVKCEDCGGTRYRPEALRVNYKGRNIHEVLALTVEEAVEVFGEMPRVRESFSLLTDIGLGYLRLGQPATTLSGGEAQRLKICAEMAEVPEHAAKGARRGKKGGGLLYVLDEPTVGLHFKDVQALLDILQRLVNAGNTVVVIEHNLDVVWASDRVIDLGPEGGDKGGRVIFSGRPEEILNIEASHTGRCLREYLKLR